MKKQTPIAAALKAMMEIKKFTISQLADVSSVPEDTIKSIRSSRTKNPGIQIICRLADALSCTVDELIGRYSVSSEEANLLERWRTLGNHGKRLIEAIAELEASITTNASEKHEIICMVPLSSFGDGVSYDNFNLEKIEISDFLYKQADFCIRITNNALSPVYFYGDTLAIEKRFPNNGEIGIFFRNNIGYIRRYSVENFTIQLLPLFPACKDLVVKEINDYVCFGTVLGTVH